MFVSVGDIALPRYVFAYIQTKTFHCAYSSYWYAKAPVLLPWKLCFQVGWGWEGCSAWVEAVWLPCTHLPTDVLGKRGAERCLLGAGREHPGLWTFLMRGVSCSLPPTTQAQANDFSTDSLRNGIKAASFSKSRAKHATSWWTVLFALSPAKGHLIDLSRS